MTAKRETIKREKVIGIVENAYEKRGYDIPKFNVDIEKDIVSVSIDSESPYLEITQFLDTMNGIVERLKDELNLIKNKNSYFYYSYYMMEFKLSK